MVNEQDTGLLYSRASKHTNGRRITFQLLSSLWISPTHIQTVSHGSPSNSSIAFLHHSNKFTIIDPPILKEYINIMLTPFLLFFIYIEWNCLISVSLNSLWFIFSVHSDNKNKLSNSGIFNASMQVMFMRKSISGSVNYNNVFEPPYLIRKCDFG